MDDAMQQPTLSQPVFGDTARSVVQSNNWRRDGQGRPLEPVLWREADGRGDWVWCDAHHWVQDMTMADPQHYWGEVVEPCDCAVERTLYGGKRSLLWTAKEEVKAGPCAHNWRAHTAEMDKCSKCGATRPAR